MFPLKALMVRKRLQTGLTNSSKNKKIYNYFLVVRKK